MDARHDEPAVSNSVGSAVAELAAIEHRSGWERVAKIVAVISKHFFGDDLKAVHQDSSRRTVSLRRLAAHPRCPLSKSQLHGLVAAHAVYRADRKVRSSTFLTPSHVSVVANLDAAERTELLKLAEQEQLSVRELTHRVRELRRRSGEKRGRPPTSAGEKAVTRFENALLFFQEGNDLLKGVMLAPDVRARLLELLDQLGRVRDQAMDRFGVAEARPVAAVRPSGIAPALSTMHRKKAS